MRVANAINIATAHSRVRRLIDEVRERAMSSGGGNGGGSSARILMRSRTKRSPVGRQVERRSGDDERR